jgi:hypothetical protein
MHVLAQRGVFHRKLDVLAIHKLGSREILEKIL